MKSNYLVLATLGCLTVACGGNNDATPAADTAAGTDTAATTEMPAAGGATQMASTDSGVVTGEIMPGGAIDVLQREGWKVTPLNDTPA